MGSVSRAGVLEPDRARKARETCGDGASRAMEWPGVSRSHPGRIIFAPQEQAEGGVPACISRLGGAVLRLRNPERYTTVHGRAICSHQAHRLQSFARLFERSFSGA